MFLEWVVWVTGAQLKGTGAMLLQGPGRLTAAEREQELRDGLTVLSTALGERPFFTGSSPTAADAAIFGFLDQIYFDFCTHEAPKRVAVEFENLLRYTMRLRIAYFPDAPVLPEHGEDGEPLEVDQ